MSITSHEAFGLFLTALRNDGVEIPLNDNAVALALVGALSQGGAGFHGGDAAQDTAENLRLAFIDLTNAKLLVEDNGLFLSDDYSDYQDAQ